MKTGAPDIRSVVAFLALSVCAALGQKAQTPAGEAPGPWLLGTIGVGKTTALKGLAIKVGENAAVCYDLDLCRMTGAWTAGGGGLFSSMSPTPARS